MPAHEEYKPGFKGWLFAVFLAAGFGNVIADGVRYLAFSAAQTDAELVLRDKQCYTANERQICNFYLENVGDKSAYITRASMADIEHQTFYTSHPFEISEEDSDKSVQRAHVGVASQKSLILIALSLPLDSNTGGEACFYKGEQLLACV